MNERPTTFHFTQYKENNNVLSFSYAYTNAAGEETHTFTETLTLAESLSPVKDLPDALRQGLFDAMHIALGMSYWKAFAVEQIDLNGMRMTAEQSEFWKTVYTKGLGEFFFVNNIDYRGLVQFPITAEDAMTPGGILSNGALVPLGGGKDSLLTATLLSESDDEVLNQITTFSVNDYPIIREQAAALGTEHAVIKRTIDPTLLELNKQEGLYNGHVPISVIYGLCAVLQAALEGRKYVVFSNEASANEGNVEYLGEEINHQWSKSIEFEFAFQEYVHEYITPDITYFSLLRPLNEVEIVTTLSSVAQPDHLQLLTSCNRNFRIASPSTQRWCGECPKCASTFALFAGVLPIEQVVELFNGQNLFDSEVLLDTYRELLGIKDFKPLDCVATISEMQYSFLQARAINTDEIEEMAAMQLFVSDVLPNLDITALEKQLSSTEPQHVMPLRAFHIIKNAAI